MRNNVAYPASNISEFFLFLLFVAVNMQYVLWQYGSKVNVVLTCF